MNNDRTNSDSAQGDCTTKKISFVFADIVSFGPLTSLASTLCSMSCGPQLSGAMRKVTMCHPPLRGVMTPFQPRKPTLFPPLCKRFALAWG